MTTSVTPENANAKAEETAALIRAQRGNKRLFVILGVAAAAAAGTLLVRGLTAGHVTTDDAQIEADVVPLAARVGGPIAKVEVADNARVKAGDVILRLDSADLAARLRQAEGELAAARAQATAADAQISITEAGARGGLSTAEAQVGTSRAQVSGAAAQVEAAKAQLLRAESDAKKAATDLARVTQLRASNALPEERMDVARAADASAQASLLAARAQLAAAEDMQKVAESRVAEASGNLHVSAPIDAKIASAKAAAELAHARVASAEGAFELARLALSYATVTAPVDGFVSNLLVREGQLLVPGQPIASVIPDRTYVIANFKETQVGAMQPGQKVEVEVDAYGGKTLAGVVESLSAGTGARFSLLPPDNASGNFVKVVQRVPVRIRWAEAPKDVVLRAGMSAVVTVHTER
ncbi:MAG: HlyD family secretion protein [Myxococcota bacterium]